MDARARAARAARRLPVIPRSAAPASTYVGTSVGRIVMIPASSNRSLRSLARTSAVSRPTDRAGRASRGRARRAGPRSATQPRRRSSPGAMSDQTLRPSSAVSATCSRSRPSAKPTAGRAGRTRQQIVVAARRRRPERHRRGRRPGRRRRCSSRGCATRPKSKITRSATPPARAASGRRACRSRPPQRAGRPLEHLGAAAHARDRQQQFGVTSLSRSSSELELDRDEVRRPRAWRGPARAAIRVTPSDSSSAGYSVTSPSPTLKFSRPTACSASQRTVSASAVPSGAGAPTSSIPACRNSRDCPRCGRTGR